MPRMIVRMGMAALAAGLLVAGSLPGQATELDGTWLRKDTGASRVRFAKCGDAVCGTIVWLKDTNGAAKVGQRVFFDMKPDGAGRWAGKAFNPEDGKTYTGKVAIDGKDMTTQGCALGGLVCRSVAWTRAD